MKPVLAYHIVRGYLAVAEELIAIEQLKLRVEYQRLVEILEGCRGTDCDRAIETPEQRETAERAIAKLQRN